MSNIKKFRIIKFKSKPILSAKSVSKSFAGRVILRKIDVHLNKGEIQPQLLKHLAKVKFGLIFVLFYYVKIKNIINYVKKISKGGYPQFGKIKLRKDEILTLYPNIQKAKKKINWKPKILFEKGLKSTIKYYNEQAK